MQKRQHSRGSVADQGMNAEPQLDADYLVIGCGAMAMAFVDVILSETDSSVIIVDRDPKPGGHWQHAYPFVKLHQPAIFYGVNSRELGTGDVTDLSSGKEVLDYFEQVMSAWLKLPLERCRFFPGCVWSHTKPMQFKSVDSSIIYRVNVRKKLVDATYLRNEIPAMHFRQGLEVKPSYNVHTNMSAHHVPINTLPKLVNREHTNYVVIGGGKTGIDAILWLLDRGVTPKHVKWVVSSDMWLVMRSALTTPEVLKGIGNPEGLKEIIPGSILKVLSCFMVCFPVLRRLCGRKFSAQSVLNKFVEMGLVKPLESGVSPSSFRCASVSEEEYRQLQRVVRCGSVVRLGRVKMITSTQIVLEHGTIPTSPATLHVDCSATGLQRVTPTSVFKENRIILQTVFICQPTFSGALIGHVEARCGHTLNVKQCNKLCGPCPHPSRPLDLLQAVSICIRNLYAWAEDATMMAWLNGSRVWLASAQNIEKVKAEAMRKYAKPFKPTEEMADVILAIIANKGLPITHVHGMLVAAKSGYSNLISQATCDSWFAEADVQAPMCGWSEKERHNVWTCLESRHGGLVKLLRERERAERWLGLCGL